MAIKIIILKCKQCNIAYLCNKRGKNLLCNALQIKIIMKIKKSREMNKNSILSVLH